MNRIAVFLITLTLASGCVQRVPANPLLKQYLDAVRLKPSATAWNELGLFYGDMGNLAAGENAFRRALALDPKSTAIRNNLGTCLARRGDMEGAFEQFQMAANVVTAHNNLAVVLYEAGEYERSRQELVKALAIQPDFAPALANLKLVHQRIEKRPEGK